MFSGILSIGSFLNDHEFNFFSSKWCTNLNFLGTYSYETVRQRMNNITSANEALSVPVKGLDGKPRILFAGEATNPNRMATVDGAIGSGFREGDRIVKLLK